MEKVLNKTKALGMIIAALVVFLLISGAVGFGYGIYIGLTHRGISSGELEVLLQSNGIYITGIADLILIVIFGIWYKKGFATSKSGMSVNPVKKILLSVIFGLSAGIGLAVMVTLIHFEAMNIKFLDPKYISYNSSDSYSLLRGNIIIQILVVAIIAPICEELVFRGVLYGYSKRIFGVIISVILVSIMFGLVHMNIEQGVFAFLFSLCLLFAYEKFTTIWAPILMHVFNNLYSVLATYYGFEEKYINTQTLVFVEMFVALIVAIVSGYFISKKK